MANPRRKTGRESSLGLLRCRAARNGSGRHAQAIHAQEDAKAAKEKACQIPAEHWRWLRTNNPLERLIREIRRRTRVAGAFPDGQSALMLAAARPRHVAAIKWGTKRYLQMNRLAEVVAIA
jgi:transposase-like protein